MNDNLLKMHLFTTIVVRELSNHVDIPISKIYEIINIEVEQLMKQKTNEELLSLAKELEKIHLNNDFDVKNEE